MPLAEFYIRYRDENTGIFRDMFKEFEAKHPEEYYFNRGFPNKATKEYAEHHFKCVQSAIIFQDTLNLKESPAKKMFGFEFDQHPGPGFDHTLVWRHPVMRKYLITTEPYDFTPGHEAIITCRARNWNYHVMPEGIGLWNPPRTRLILISPGDKGLPLDCIVRALEGKMPIIGKIK